mgnify:CR=1 FL=1
MQRPAEFTRPLKNFRFSLVDWSGRGETLAGTARVRRSTWDTRLIVHPKLAEAVPEESEPPVAEINLWNTTYSKGLFQ